jgi:TRAP-type C4-dicarboxylate transport system permease small subunit
VKTFLERLNALVLLCMFCITVLTVVFRGVLGVSASWSEELAQLTFILLVFIGAGAVMEDEGHIRINTVVERLGNKAQRAVRILGRLLMIPFLVLFAGGAWDNAVVNWETDLGTVAWMKIGHMYLALVFTTVVMLYYLVVNIVRDVRNTYGPGSALKSVG